jgi:hypothetical protein
MSSLAFYASPVDYRNNDLENKIMSDKKIDKQSLQMLQNSMSKSTENYSVSSITDLHNNLKAENEKELFKFYKNELNNKNEKVNTLPIIKTDQYMLIDDQTNVEKYNKKQNNNQDVIERLNRMIEMFEEQKEIKTNKKNEEIVLYCFLGVFTIYIIDSFVSIGKYSR